MDARDRALEQAVLEAYPVGVGDRILMAREQVFELEARLLVVKRAGTLGVDAGLGHFVERALQAHGVATWVGRGKARNSTAAVSRHRLAKPLLGARNIALLEGIVSGEDCHYWAIRQRLRVGSESRGLGVLQCPHQLRAVETGLRPKDEAAEQPVELPQGLAGSDASQCTVDAFGIVG